MLLDVPMLKDDELYQLFVVPEARGSGVANAWSTSLNARTDSSAPSFISPR